MKIFVCECGSNDVFTEKKGSHIGLYCGDCGKWLKWLSKEDLRLVERQIKENKK